MIKAILFDLSGVLYSGQSVIDGALDAIRLLQHSNLQIRYVTNTSRITRSTLLKQLLDFGFDIQSHELYTAPSAARDWAMQNEKRPYCLVHDNIKSEFSRLDQANPNAVIIGDAEDGFNYRSLNRAFQLCREGAPLIGIGRNRYFKLHDQLMLDAGPFIQAIEYAASTQAIIMGKPSAAFFGQVLKSIKAKPNEVLMIGDDVFGDVQGALEYGLQACLVKTGKYLEGDEKLIEGNFLLYPSVVEIVDAVLNHKLSIKP